MLLIDGSQGEGGGQVLRTSLALSLVTGMPFRMENIRVCRASPGLQAQHLAAIDAARRVCEGHVEGATVGSRQICFTPGPVRAGEYRFTVGTAGSATLVLQTVLPALMMAAAPSSLRIDGGTHNPWAPPYDFLERAFLPLVGRMGPTIRARLLRHGFYPAGGGCIEVEIEPVRRLGSLRLLERGPVKAMRVAALVSKLPLRVARREIGVVLAETGWESRCTQALEVRSAGPGNVLIIALECEHVTEVITGFGKKGLAAETVAQRAVDEVQRYLAADVPVGRHLADQLLLPIALAAWHGTKGEGRASGSAFRTFALSGHARTNIAVIRTFLDVDLHAEQVGEDRWELAAN